MVDADDEDLVLHHPNGRVVMAWEDEVEAQKGDDQQDEAENGQRRGAPAPPADRAGVQQNRVQQPGEDRQHLHGLPRPQLPHITLASRDPVMMPTVNRAKPQATNR